ncbi:MAG: flippase [Clostridiales bacterium]|nr:flippase [Clostridiales bacterium]
MSSIKKNLGLQTAYQVLATCMPLITAPYLARTLGKEQLGIFSYTSSIVAYFTLAAMLGTVNYGTRSIAAVKNDREKRNELFSGIFAIQVIVTLLACIAYIVYLVFFCRDNILIALIQGLALLNCFVNITWLFFGVEDFQITVTRSIVIKLLTVSLILLIVKNENDLWIYTLIMLGGTLLSDLVLFLYLPRYASIKKVSGSQIRAHIKPNLILFIPLLAMTVYHTMDKTMLGAMSSYEQSGLYYYSDKIVQMPLMVINGIGTVMLPRMTALITDKKQKEADDLFMRTMEGVAVVSIAILCGIAGVSNEFIPIFYGKGYDACILITVVFCPILLIKSFSVIARTQYLIPMKMEKEFTKSVVGGAIANLVFNFILIPPLGALGAAIATVIAELVACALQFISLRGKDLGIASLLKQTIIYSLMGVIMIIGVRFVALLHMRLVFKLILEILVGASIFSVTCLTYWRLSKNVFFKVIRNPMRNRVKKS